jgi:hypothetical protein
MTDIKTPEQIARYAFMGADSQSLTVQIAKRITAEAIEADRAQRDTSIHAAVIEAVIERSEDAPEVGVDIAAWIESFPDEFWDRFVDPMLTDLESAARTNDLYEEN